MIERLRAWWKRYRHQQMRAHQRAHGLYIMDMAETPIARTSRPMAPMPSASVLPPPPPGNRHLAPPPIRIEVAVMHRCPHCGGEVRFDDVGSL